MVELCECSARETSGRSTNVVGRVHDEAYSGAALQAPRPRAAATDRSRGAIRRRSIPEAARNKPRDYHIWKVLKSTWPMVSKARQKSRRRRRRVAALAVAPEPESSPGEMAVQYLQRWAERDSDSGWKFSKKRQLKEIPIATREAIVRMYLEDHVFQCDIAKYFKISPALVSKLVK